jgi:hypothetical protein
VRSEYANGDRSVQVLPLSSDHTAIACTIFNTTIISAISDQFPGTFEQIAAASVTDLLSPEVKN